MKKVAIVIFGLVATYLIWANTGKETPDNQQFSIDVVETFGDSTSGKNLLGVQAFMEPSDYASETNFKKKIEFYLQEAQQRNLLIRQKTIVVFPEYIASFLVTAHQKTSIYEAKTMQAGLQTMVLSNLPNFIKTYFRADAQIRDKISHSVFAMQAPKMAEIYQRVFSELAKKYEVSIVAGSILLPNPTIQNQKIVSQEGQLYNVSAFFHADGTLDSQLVKKAFPTASEQKFVCAANPNQIPIFDTPLGKMAVLICADAWYSASYQHLANKNVDFVVVPSYSDGHQLWNKPWGGYSGNENPDEVKTDVGKITLGQAWTKYAMAGRAKNEAGIKKGINVFLQGKIWDIGADGSTILLNDSTIATPHIGKAGLFCLWL